MLKPSSLIQVFVFAFAWTALDCHAQDPSHVDFFESKIRPILIEHCYECHSGDSAEIAGSLRLDFRDGLLRGGDSGPAMVPGDAKLSRLMSAIRYESSEMPPDGKLSEEVVSDFDRWISAGAVDPRGPMTHDPQEESGVDWEQAKNFWAFQPRSVVLPSELSPDQLGDGVSASLIKMPSDGLVDDYLNHEMALAGLTPNPLADPEVQLRRLSLDLTGLPPTIQLQDRWLADPSHQNWVRIVNELLASKGFGEHWARHWMDVARYADSNGSDFNATFHEAWRYREYLIRAFMLDQPFDEMIRQQIAGDLLPHQDDAKRLDNVVATTFLMLGPKMLSERDKAKLELDVIDEQIDTVGRAFMGLTLGCARCHDHKFDPIPTEDYYALAGIFSSTQTLNGESQKYVSTWNRVPLPVTEQQRLALETHQRELKRMQGVVKEVEQKLKVLKASLDGLMDGIVLDDVEAKKIGHWRDSTFVKHFVGKGYVHDDASGKGEASIQYSTVLPQSGHYEVRVSYSPGTDRAKSVPITLTTANGELQLVLDQRSISVEPMWSSLGIFDLSAEADTRLTIRNEGTTGHVIADAVQFIFQQDQRLHGEDPRESSAASGKQNAEGMAIKQSVEQTEKRLSKLKGELEDHKKNTPPALPVAMAPSDRAAEQIGDSHIHIRGEVRNLGDVISRGFVRVCNSQQTELQESAASGRQELASWLTDPNHPLVARVFVNRVWMHLLGEGIVRTVDNFGYQGERPTHPELLDYLASDFVNNEWRLKSLVRKIVISQAYRRSSQDHSASISLDPENRLLWKAPRRRLTAESIRDSIIFSTGQLDAASRIEPMAGRGVLVSSNNSDSAARFDDVALPVRSIYLPIVRGYLPDLLLALDMADPDLLVGKRPTTNVPGQALILINSQDIRDWAAVTRDRLLEQAMSFESRLEAVSRLLLQRFPKPHEIAIARKFFDGREADDEAWLQYISAIYASAPFRFID